MKRILILALSLCSMSAFAQWDWGGGGGFNFGGGGFNFGGEGSGNSGNIGDYQKKGDIDYVGDNHVGHKMDVYFPKDDGKATHPVLIHIYGSAWGSNNSKGSADLGTVGTAALGAGYILVTPNHRTYNDALYPAQINDIKAVVRYLRGNAQELGVDTSFIAVSGFSSGGHLASLMGVTRNVEDNYTYGSATMNIEGNLGRYTEESSWVDAVCDWSGPVDCRDKGCGNPIQMSPENDMVGGCNDQQCPDKHALLGANTFIDETDAPVFVAHGSSDNIVPQCEGKKFYDNLVAKNVQDCEYHPHGGGHGVEGSLTGEMITFLNKIKEKKAASIAAHMTDPGEESLLNDILSLNNSICVDNDRLYLCNESAEATEFNLSDVSGKILMIGTLDSKGVDISSLNQGVYLVRTNNGGSFKFIK
ncbi:MAG: alpha/beta hydrolase fold domain-containing protein [Paludibacteraceae bacterium]|nr:alpha/beta hydrolase fold domain-containing protein [Paludibacteraceae bacterium]